MKDFSEYYHKPTPTIFDCSHLVEGALPALKDLETATVYKPTPDVFYMTYRGSIAHNMFVPKNDPNHIDDTDLMGFAFGSKENYFGLTDWSNRGTREIKEGVFDVVIYEIRKAFQLLLQGNPNILSMLWVKPFHHLVISDTSKKLLANRHVFVGKHVHAAFAGYAKAQLVKMESRDPAELREYIAVTNELKYRGIHPNHKGEKFTRPSNDTGYLAVGDGISAQCVVMSSDKLLARMAHFHKKGENLGYMGDKRKQLVLEHGYDSKNAAHLVRLLRMAIEFLGSGELQVLRVDDRQELLDIKQGKWKLEDIKVLATDLFEQAKQAYEKSPLPEGPDKVGAEKLLVELLEENFLVKT